MTGWLIVLIVVVILFLVVMIRLGIFTLPKKEIIEVKDPIPHFTTKVQCAVCHDEIEPGSFGTLQVQMSLPVMNKVNIPVTLTICEKDVMNAQADYP